MYFFNTENDPVVTNCLAALHFEINKFLLMKKGRGLINKKSDPQTMNEHVFSIIGVNFLAKYQRRFSEFLLKEIIRQWKLCV